MDLLALFLASVTAAVEPVFDLVAVVADSNLNSETRKSLTNRESCGNCPMVRYLIADF